MRKLGEQCTKLAALLMIRTGNHGFSCKHCALKRWREALLVCCSAPWTLRQFPHPLTSDDFKCLSTVQSETPRFKLSPLRPSILRQRQEASQIYSKKEASLGYIKLCFKQIKKPTKSIVSDELTFLSLLSAFYKVLYR